MAFERERSHQRPLVAGRYALYDKIATGGMATVHLGRLLGPIGFSRTVAIKRMLPQFVSDLGFVSMFVDEARLASRIRHPNVVPTLDVVAQRNELFLVLEYVHGETLSQIIKALSEKQERIPPAFAASIVCGMLHGLHAAHNVKNEHGAPLGLVHRDVSPQNVLVGTDCVARLLDFGVAKAAGRMQVTTNGEVKGKLAYMAPEQVTGTVTPQSDVYSAAAVLWEALTCERLFHNVTWTNIAQVILNREVEPPSSIVPDLSPTLDAIVLRGLEKDPRNRFASAREMAVAIESCLPLAPAHEVGEWVEQTAFAMLAERAQKIAEIESRASESKMVAASMSIEERMSDPVDPKWDGIATEPDKIVDAGSQLMPIEEATMGSPGTPLTQVSSREFGVEARRHRSRRLAGIAAFMACVAAASGWLVERNRAQPAARRNHAEPRTAAPAQPPAAMAALPAPPPAIAPAVNVEQVDEDAKPAAEPLPALPTVTRPTPKRPPAAAAAAKRAACNPPYVVDESHIRHIKPECL
jgi:eukaryotic-like serine/threonine-protein kinase